MFFFLELCVTCSFSSFRFHFIHHILREAFCGRPVCKDRLILEESQKREFSLSNASFLLYSINPDINSARIHVSWTIPWPGAEQVPGTSCVFQRPTQSFVESGVKGPSGRMDFCLLTLFRLVWELGVSTTGGSTLLKEFHLNCATQRGRLGS